MLITYCKAQLKLRFAFLGVLKAITCFRQKHSVKGMLLTTTTINQHLAGGQY